MAQSDSKKTHTISKGLKTLKKRDLSKFRGAKAPLAPPPSLAEVTEIE